MVPPYTLSALMLSTPYMRIKTLRGQHTSNVNCLAFSPHAEYLASGSDDGHLIIWNVKSGAVACNIDAQNPVLSVVWDPRRRSTVFFGCEGGVAGKLGDFEVSSYCRLYPSSPYTWVQDPSSAAPVLTGTKGPVYCLDLEPASGLLAVGVGPEVHIAKAIQQGSLSRQIQSKFIQIISRPVCNH